MKSILVTQSFGRENEYRRVIFMIWSFWAQFSVSAKVILFTDRPDYFQSYFSGFEIEYIQLTSDKIKQMRGDIDFLHRMKIALIEEAFRMSDGNLLYADSDTFFTADPSPLLEKISRSNAFMHTREYAFESIRQMPLPAGKTFRAFVSLIDENVFNLADGSTLKITADQSSWNAGVMMFHQSHADLLSDVFSLTDQFYPTTQNHASEQYAFSVVMQNKLVLDSCEKVIYHYWYRIKKEIMDIFLEKNLRDFLKFSIDQRITLIKKWTIELPLLFERHVLTLRDQSIQSFHENNFKKGYGFALRAMMKNPFDYTFIKNLVYHTKRCLRIIGKLK
ncbi:MAG TPA: hypothetical protein VIT44_07845 [Cyclobacteriaceae bacterium]